MNKLSKAREFCFQYLFHLQLPIFNDLKKALQSNTEAKELQDSISEFKETTNNLFDDKLNLIIQNRIAGIMKEYDYLEELVQKNLKNWKISRLSKVDHTLLLLTAYELSFELDTPAKVIINEGVELSKKFSTNESAKFVNGVLDSIAKSVENRA